MASVEAIRFYNEGCNYQFAGLIKKAISKWSKAVELDPDFISARYNLGRGYMEIDLFDSAINEFEAVLKREPLNLEARLDLGFSYEKNGRIGEAILEYNKVLKTDKTNRRAHKNLGIALAGNGKRKEAIPHLEVAVDLDPNDSDTHYVLGDVLLKEYISLLESGHREKDEKLTEMLDKSRKVLERACQLNPGDIEARRSLEIAKDPKRLLDIKGPIEKMMTEEYQNLVRQSIELVRADRGKEAIPHLEEAIDYEPNIPFAHYLLGHILREDKQFDRATKELEKALKLNPKDQIAEAELHFARTSQSIKMYTDIHGTSEEILKKLINKALDPKE